MLRRRQAGRAAPGARRVFTCRQAGRPARCAPCSSPILMAVAVLLAGGDMAAAVVAAKPWPSQSQPGPAIPPRRRRTLPSTRGRHPAAEIVWVAHTDKKECTFMY